ncbi:MAG: DMT family transporter [Coriobacteriales bacterium]|nr:DMT family transporter [Coriobacteriales bacterium]
MTDGRGHESARGRRMAVGVASTLLGAIAWGFSGTCVQFLFATTQMDALLLTTIRELGAGLVFVAVLVLRQRSLLRAMLADRGTLWRLAIFGSCGLFLNSTLYALTISHTNAGTATVLQSLNIVMVLAISCVVGRRLPRRLETAALVCALAATFLIATHGDPSQLQLPAAGLVLGLATAAAATFYTMYPKPLFQRWGSFAVTGLGMLAGGITGLVACTASGTIARGLPTIDTAGAVVLAIAVLVGTFGAYGLFLHGISIVGPVAGNMLGAAEPVSATVISALWLATSFAWADWAGLALMVATIVLIACEGRV